MVFSSCVRNWKGILERRWAFRRTQRRITPAHGVARRLYLEVLEDRTLLSPQLIVNNLVLDGSNGTVVRNSGTFSDTTAGATVTLTASAGTIVQSVNGTWTWSETTPAGAAQTGPVEIYATDNQGGTATADFWLNAGQVFVVGSTDDNGGVNPAPGVGTGTLRQAIVDANNTPTTGGPNLIVFDIPTSDPGCNSGAFTITLQSALPAISNPTIIDGYTQPGTRENTLTNGNNAILAIQINGTNVPGDDEFSTVALSIAANNCTVQGLAINSTKGSNIYVTGSNNHIQGNFIGTDVSGTQTPFTPNLSQFVASDYVGIHINGGSGNVIGTDGDSVNDPAERNIISGNNYGIALRTTSNSVVAGNFIGTDASGTHALANWIGIGTLLGAQGDRIGTNGTDADVAGERNIISGNAAAIVFGVGLPGPAESNGLVAGNWIGLGASGNALSNAAAGIFVGVSSSNITIGGSQAALANTIANTQGRGPGVWILNFRGAPTGIRVQGNSIYNNTGLGIDLGGSYPPPAPDGVTLNDSEGHVGPNNFQNFPVLNSAVSSSSDTSITGSFSEADEQNKQITLDFYANSTAAPSGYGQGQTYLGSAQVTTDASGNASFSVDFGTGNLAGEWITATATCSGSTSEFAKDFQATAASSGQSYTSAYLQTLLPQSSTTTNQLTIQTGPSLSQSTILAAVNGLTVPTRPVTIILNLNGGTYNDTTVNPPANVTLIIDGANGTNTFVGHSPAFTITGGNVIVRNVTFTTTTDAPTILVTGGNLTLRNDTIQESTGATDAAISITGGIVDLGMASDLGGNTLNVNGSGEFIHNTTTNSVSAVGDSFQINGTVQSASSLSFTTATSSTATTVLNQPVTLTATVRANGSSGLPTGSVDFFDSTTNAHLGSASLSGAVATLTTSTLSAGNHVIVAIYGGDANFLPSLDTLTQSVHYQFSGFQPPLSSGATFGVNRTIPIKFQLTDYNGAYISSPSAVTLLQVLNSSQADVLAGAGTTGLRYDSTSNQFVYNWQSKGLPAGAYTIRLDLADSTTQSLTLSLTASGGSAKALVVLGANNNGNTSAPLLADVSPASIIASSITSNGMASDQGVTGPSSDSLMSVVDQVLTDLARLLSDVRNVYQSELVRWSTMVTESLQWVHDERTADLLLSDS